MLSGLLSLAMQVARLVQGPKMARRGRKPIANGAGEGRCGYCPVCQAFIALAAPGADGMAPCPRCGRSIRDVEPLA